ncbi:hypothetical protein LSAT2_001096, partial [Lamellibrachia satsuma]
MVSVCFVDSWSANQIYFAMYNLGFPVDFNGYFYHFTAESVTIEDACFAVPLSGETRGQGSTLGDMAVSISTNTESCGGDTTAYVQFAE